METKKSNYTVNILMMNEINSYFVSPSANEGQVLFALTHDIDFAYLLKKIKQPNSITERSIITTQVLTC